MGQGYDELDWSDYGAEDFEGDGLAHRGFEDACRAAIQPADQFGGPPGRWRDRQGDLRRIRKMELSHLRNCVALLERKGFGEHAKTDELREEIARRTRPKERPVPF